MRVLLTVMLLGLAGCVQHEPGPDLTDRGELPQDISAPPPEDDFEDLDPFDPPGVPWIHGRVLGADGRPVKGAAVWIETTDIREQVDNLQDYLDGRSQSLVLTDAAGRYRFFVDESLYHVTVEAPGHLMLRITDVEGLVNATAHDLQLRARGDPIVVAHRGASFYAPENTLASLWKARWLGADTVEVDVRLSRDGHLVAFHDPDLDRTTDGEGRLRDHTLAQLRLLDAGSWFDESFRGQRIPTLQEFLAAADEAQVHVMVDVKSPPDLRYATWTRTLQVIQQEGAEERVTFAAFREDAIVQCSRVPGLECMWLRDSHEGYTDLPGAAKRLGATWLGVHADLADQAFVDRAHGLGLQVQTWTLNEPEPWRRVVALGVDAVATDRMGYLVDDLNGVELHMN